MEKILIGVLLFLQCNLHAQHRWEVGATVGVNTSDIYFDFSNIKQNFFGQYRATTIRYGLTAEFNMNRKFSLILELNKESRGFDRASIDWRYNFISLPLLLEYRFGRKRNFCLDFGTHFAIKTSGSRISQITGLPDLTEVRCPECEVGRLDWGFILGIGYRYAITDRITTLASFKMNVSQSAYEDKRGYKHYAYAPIIGITYGLGKPR